MLTNTRHTVLTNTQHTVLTNTRHSVLTNTRRTLIVDLQAKEKLKQVDDQLKLKELERTEKEKISTALEAAVKEKKEKLQEMAKQAECLGKEVAPGEGEAEQVSPNVTFRHWCSIKTNLQII